MKMFYRAGLVGIIAMAFSRRKKKVEADRERSLTRQEILNLQGVFQYISIYVSSILCASGPMDPVRLLRSFSKMIGRWI